MDENADRQFTAGQEHRYPYRDEVNRSMHRLTCSNQPNTVAKGKTRTRDYKTVTLKPSFAEGATT